MKKKILIDGVRYVYRPPKNEKEIEEILKEYVEDLFGKSSIFFPKRKLHVLMGMMTTPGSSQGNHGIFQCLLADGHKLVTNGGNLKSE